MTKKEIALKLIENLRIIERITECAISDYEIIDPNEIFIHVDIKSKTASAFNDTRLSKILFNDLQLELGVREPIEIFYKANEPIYELLHELLNIDPEVSDYAFDLDSIEEIVHKL